MDNVDTVQHIYESFGRGDIPAILDHLAASVEWEYGVPSTDVPWLKPRHGSAEVKQFFESLSTVARNYGDVFSVRPEPFDSAHPEPVEG